MNRKSLVHASAYSGAANRINDVLRREERAAAILIAIPYASFCASLVSGNADLGSYSLAAMTASVFVGSWVASKNSKIRSILRESR